MIYYGYRRGDNDKVVDWASVSSEMTQDLRDIEERREQERNKIEGEIAEAKKNIDDVPLGNYETMNSFALDGSYQAAEELRVSSALLRSGKMKPSEFAKKQQNILDSFKFIKNSASTFNERMDAGLQRINDGEAGKAEANSLKEMERIADLANSVLVFQPNGAALIAPKGKDGKPIMKEAVPASEMQNITSQKYDRFDMNGQLDPIVEKYGEEIQVLKSGGILTRSDILQRKFGAAEKSMEEVIDDTMLQYTDEQLASVLMDYIQGYEETSIVDDETDRNSQNLILVGKNGSLGNRKTFNLTDEQKEKARQAIKEQLLAKLDLVERPMATAGSGQTEADKKRKASADAALEETTRLWNLFTGDEAKKAEVMDVYRPSIEALLGKGNYGGYDITDDQIILYQRTKDGLEPRVIDIPSDFKSFVDLASTNFGLSKNLDEMYDKSIAGIEGFNSDAKYVTANVQKRPSIMYKPTKTIDEAASDLDDALGEITSGFGYYGKDEITAGKIGLDAARAAKSYLTSVGLTGAIVEKGDGNSVKITLDGITPRGGITVKLTETKSGARADLGTALKVIHDAAGMGQLVTGYPTAEEPPEPPKPETPDGTQTNTLNATNRKQK